MEEQNLSLIQNSQETEETLEEMKHSIKTTRKKMFVDAEIPHSARAFAMFLYFFREKETVILKEQIDRLNAAIEREESKAKDLEIKSRWVQDRSYFRQMFLFL